MQYTFVSKFSYKPSGLRVCILEKEIELRRLYSDLLDAAGYKVSSHGDYNEIMRLLSSDTPHALIMNPIHEGRLLTGVLERFRNLSPRMHIVTVGYGMTDNDMKLLMRVGVASHINRHFSQPQDIIQVLNTLSVS